MVKDKRAKPKKVTVHKRVGKSGTLAADGRTYYFGAGPRPKLTNKWVNVTCKMCLRQKPKTKPSRIGIK